MASALNFAKDCMQGAVTNQNEFLISERSLPLNCGILCQDGNWAQGSQGKMLLGRPSFCGCFESNGYSSDVLTSCLGCIMEDNRSCRGYLLALDLALYCTYCWSIGCSFIQKSKGMEVVRCSLFNFVLTQSTKESKGKETVTPWSSSGGTQVRPGVSRFLSRGLLWVNMSQGVHKPESTDWPSGCMHPLTHVDPKGSPK